MALTAIVLVAAACGDADVNAGADGFSIPEALEENVYLTGIGIAGREDLPRSAYLEAAVRGCVEGGWDWEVAADIAADLLEPVPLGLGASGAGAVWSMIAVACHDRIPQDALDRGPPPPPAE